MATTVDNLPQKPKIINTTPIIHRDAKTIVVYSSPNELNEKLMRFHNSIITNLETYNEYSKILEKPVHLLLINKSELNGLKNIKTAPEKYFQNVSMFILTNSIIEYLVQIFPNLREFAKNLIVLDNIHHHFTYFRPWNGTLIDAASIISLIHGSQIIQINSQDQDTLNAAIRNEIQKITPISPPPEFWMFTQFYKPKEKSREMEINETLRFNTDCEFIDKIVIFLEKDEHKEDIKRILAKKPRSALAKIRFVSLLHRLSYSDFFNYVISDEVPDNTYVALTNADIYFDNSIGNIWSISMENRLLALLRYEHSDDGTQAAKMFGPRPDSQDTWIFSAASIKQRKWTQEYIEKFNYQLGIPGCDNSFTTDMIREKFLTVNPAGTIRTYHYHTSQIRNYTKKDILWRPIYIHITPTGIPEFEQNTLFSSEVKVVPVSNTINITSNTQARAQTYCTMLARGQKYVWNVGTNTMNSKFKIFELKNVTSCSHGVLFDSFRIFTGNQEEIIVTQYIKSANINHFNRTVTIENFVSVPIVNRKIYEEPGLFITEYVIPLLFILKTVSKDNIYSIFWPELFQSFLKFIDFPVMIKVVPIIPESHSINFYSEKSWAIMPGSFRMCKEAIEYFRNCWKLEPSIETSNILTFIDNGKLFSVKDEKFIKDLEKILVKYGWELDIVLEGTELSQQFSKLALSGGILFWNDGQESQLARIWRGAWNMLPGSAFLEFQNEFKLSGESQEFASACGLDSRIFILQKADDNYLRGLVLKYVEDYLQAHPKSVEPVGSSTDGSSPVEEVSLNLNV